MCLYFMVLFCFPSVASKCGLLASLNSNDPPKDWVVPLVVTTKGPVHISRECTGLFCGWADESLQTTWPPLPTGSYGPYQEIALLTGEDFTGWWSVQIVGVSVVLVIIIYFSRPCNNLGNPYNRED